MLEIPQIRACIAIGFGAIAGALSRYYLGLWLIQSINTGFPAGTLIINLSGCFLMGLITTVARRNSLLHPDLMLLLTTGFLGAYTTFSSYELDVVNLLEIKNLQEDLLYWIGSPLLGLLCFRGGVALVKLTIPVNSTND
ncbi:MAG TPA: fluoride efflux transporter CrcB [Xenococcaceae cyanobacterium]|jgi:CrcB protein